MDGIYAGNLQMESGDAINSLIVVRHQLKICVKSWLFLVLIKYCGNHSNQRTIVLTLIITAIVITHRRLASLKLLKLVPTL